MVSQGRKPVLDCLEESGNEVQQSLPFPLLKEVVHVRREPPEESHGEIVTNGIHVAVRDVVEKMNRGGEDCCVLVLESAC